MPTRIAGKKGRLPAKHYDEIDFVEFYMKDGVTIPAGPPTADFTGGIAVNDWLPLGNMDYGDCGIAGEYHLEMADAAIGKESYLTLTDTIALTRYCAYLSYVAGSTITVAMLEAQPSVYDTGVCLIDYLLWLFKMGYIDAFGQLNVSKGRAYVQSWANVFKGAYMGVNLTDNDINLFNENKVWDDTDPDPSEGHCIPYVCWSTQYDGYVTWAHLQMATPGWTSACCYNDTNGEGFVIITKELAEIVGWDINAAIADIKSIGGTSIPAPAPAPTPATLQNKMAAEMSRHTLAMTALIKEV